MNFPEFKKTESMKDGNIIEAYYIDNIEVTEKTYYALLYDREESSDCIQTTSEQRKAVEKAIHAVKLEDSEGIEVEDIDGIKEDYIEKFLKKLFLCKYSDAYDLLYKELNYHYILGYLIGQKELNETFLQGMNTNIGILQGKVNEINRGHDI